MERANDSIACASESLDFLRLGVASFTSGCRKTKKPGPRQKGRLIQHVSHNTWSPFGGSASIFIGEHSPVALRPRLSSGLPVSVELTWFLAILTGF